jgi:hypothetical protein
MSIRLQLLREAWSFLSTFVGKVGEVVVDTTNNRLVVHDGVTVGGWPMLSNPPGNVTALGIGTAADPSNPLSVYGSAALFNTAGSFQVKVNKASAANTASFLFQDAYSGRAEIGLMGDDNFHFKVSGDGSAWSEALSINSSTGAIGIGTPSPATKLDVSGPVRVGQYTVATLPTGVTGAIAYASNARVFNGAGVQEAAGAGTGSLVVYTASAWKVVGTNVPASA